MTKKQPTLRFFGTAKELQFEIQGDWVTDERTSKLNHNGKTLVTWHPTTGTLLFQGKSHIANGLHEYFLGHILTKDKFKGRTTADLRR